jgi:hypothetical protein
MTAQSILFSEVEKQSFKYLGNGTVLVSLTTTTGDVIYTVDAATFMRSINAGVALMNQNLPAFLKEIAAR